MIIDLTQLNSSIKDTIKINENLSFTDEDLKGTDLIDLKDVIVDGEIYKGNLDNYNLNLKIKGKMILPCSRTLKPTEHDFNIEIDENLEENQENFKKNQKSIDIFPIIWENILMEIPMKVISEKAKNISLEGNGWKFTQDED